MNAPVTRRALLGATAAVGAVELPRAASAAADASDPDAALIDLIRQHDKAREAMDRGSAADDAAFVSDLMAVPPRPDALRWREDDFPRTSLEQALSIRGEGEERWYGDKAVAWMRDRPAATWFASLVPALGGECEARRLEILSAWDAHEAAKQAAKVATGYAATSEASDAAADLLVSLAAKIAASRPLTLQGLRALGAWFARQVEAGDLHDDFLEQLAEVEASFGEAAS